MGRPFDDTLFFLYSLGMADKPVYAHGELDAVKKRLGPISDAEARKMQAILGTPLTGIKKARMLPL